MRRSWVEASQLVSMVRQCELASVSRATVYAHRKPQTTSPVNLLLQQLIDEEYTRHPFYGSRKMVIYLRGLQHEVNRKRVQRLMRCLGLAGMAPGPNTSRAHPKHKVYPYLLRGTQIDRPNQVWSTDITYIRMEGGFAYLVAVIDWYSRKVLSWRISNTLDTTFCIDCLSEALKNYEKPEIFNTDQGVQFTSKCFTRLLEAQGVSVSMDGRGRALDNIFVERLWRSVKYEDIYLKGYENMLELEIGLLEYFAFYNEKRPHQSLRYKTPDLVYKTGTGGGAQIEDKFGDGTQNPFPVLPHPARNKPSGKEGQRLPAAT